MDELTGKQIGPYALAERIGRGGMSEVYRSEDEDGTAVALKLLRIDPAQEDNEVFLVRFEREAQIILDLQHPNILSILDYGQASGYAYIVTPYIAGGTLADVIRRGPVELVQAARWLVQIAAALDHAHAMHIVHRDLKPSNVLLDEAGKPFLMDFGIARFSNMVRDLTETGSVLGTPAYMAPEQWRAEPLNARTDVYGLAVMAFLMLTTHTPFEADTPHALMYRHLDEAPTPLARYLPEVPPGLEAVIQKALTKSAAGRHASAGAS
ncbi:MAG: serine/threonine protein kinase, partial [Anaerolineae bacterium]|nr:serine/threonine protein kinase [Anaerolineae bacterium]